MRNTYIYIYIYIEREREREREREIKFLSNKIIGASELELASPITSS